MSLKNLILVSVRIQGALRRIPNRTTCNQIYTLLALYNFLPLT